MASKETKKTTKKTKENRLPKITAQKCQTETNYSILPKTTKKKNERLKNFSEKNALVGLFYCVFWLSRASRFTRYTYGKFFEDNLLATYRMYMYTRDDDKNFERPMFKVCAEKIKEKKRYKARAWKSKRSERFFLGGRRARKIRAKNKMGERRKNHKANERYN